MNDRAATPSEPGRHDPKRSRCRRCGYDLRGADSDRCPECGAVREHRLAFPDRHSFLLAHKVLEPLGLVERSLDPGAGIPGLSQMIVGIVTTGEIWIADENLDEARRALEAQGMHLPVPIVDRSDPTCPNCEEPLDPDAPAPCPHCGGLFDWVDIDEPFKLADGTCRACGYDLTGLEEPRCPECGALPRANVERLVADAVARIDVDDEAYGVAPPAPSPAVRPLVLLAIIAFPGALLIWMLVWSSPPGLWPSGMAAAGWLLAGLGAFAVLGLRLVGRRERTPHERE